MTKPKLRNQGPLSKMEIDTIRMVALGWTNEQIAEKQGVRLNTVQTRISALCQRIGCAAGDTKNGGYSGVSRARMTAWAYENGIVSLKGTVTPERREALADRAFEVCRQIVHKRPYLMVRAEAVAIIREADADLCADEAA